MVVDRVGSSFIESWLRVEPTMKWGLADAGADCPTSSNLLVLNTERDYWQCVIRW